LAFCTQSDVEHRLQWDITAEPETVVTELIAHAQALIESEVGRPLESDDYTGELHDGHVGAIFLEHWPVTAVSDVTEDGTTLAAGDDYIFYEDDGRLVRVSGGHQIAWLTRKLQAISVDYTGGFVSPDHELELDHLKTLCTEVVARAFRQGAASAVAPAGAGLGGINAVSIEGSDSVTFGAVGGETIELGGGLSRFVFLLDDEKRQLVQYQTPPIA